MPQTISRAVGRFQRAAIGLQKLKEKDALADRFAPVLTSFFREYERRFMFRFNVAMRDMFAEEQPKMMAEGDEDEDIQKELNTLNMVVKSVEFDTTPRLKKIITYINKESYKQGTEQMREQLKFFDPEKSFDLSNPRAVRYFRQTGGSVKYIKDIQDTTAKSVESLITTALERGWSYTKTASALRDLFDDSISNKRAKLIAVTESARAYETGNRDFAKSIEDDGVTMEKMWMTSQDDKVSDGCAENMAEGWVEMDHLYGDEQITEPPRFPGCRCYMLYQEAKK